MHKSVILSLFLMGSLIMLVSFTSMNVFSNAMAQGYDNEYEDRYYDKTNSYNNNYHNDPEKYNDYPDKVNKYECQKGPFEGFFVSSPEFCIKKITPEKKIRPEPEPVTATLNVTKQITCQDEFQGQDCSDFEALITEDQYLIQVEGNNPVPSQFPGSESGTAVTLGPGNYTVSETVDASFNQDIATFQASHPGRLLNPPALSFTGNCTAPPLDLEATGIIAAGESQTCNVINSFFISAP
jgi:hypothetical protein